MDKKIKIAYLVNPDPVFFNELDQKIIDLLENKGAIVTKVDLNTLYIQLDSRNIEFFNNGKLLDFDAFYSYGYMRQQNKEYYQYIINSVEAANKIVFHSFRVIQILENKLLQANAFAHAGVPIPKTFCGFYIDAVKQMYKQNFTKNSVIKTLSDYGGDGVKLSKHPDEGVTTVSKIQWDNKATLSQEFIDDTWGKSIRVLVINGKGYACAEYQDLSQDFRSNVSYHENFKLVSKMQDPRLKEYYNIAENAVHAIEDNILIAGVDVLDSKKHGLVVLEINCWPDLYDIQEATQLPIFDTFIDLLYKKAKSIKYNGIANGVKNGF
ncbi:ribosomal protein s6 modification protein, putative [Ichthyophthirius multifiliis]|uniref:Ribosomal protein s6 modification protein, putative n=1 Tax=Ichthyophthirius multifiliis TaxID=5932 RepID=G0QYJ4_ICHMU|nr:ribosomal protein s6 modification protein, putative [Ichthyophthirius multifiliis]EGR29719.1 ribosomal protein s6 modification protein, putative [Ichthyophthirius multifiliis]|eukprot:XP_004030955.1 ribosomal protein s6 modification protein, putative [Ichthyophthirius multifiliis]